MNILFVCKRFYTNKDVIRDQYGRLYYFPTTLAKRGHSVTVLCLDYKNLKPIQSHIEYFEGGGSIEWVNSTFLYFIFFKFIHILFKSKKSDLIIGASDIPCLYIAKIFSLIYGKKYIIDLYDNFESFGQANIFGFKKILEGCIKHANKIICVSEMLKDKISNQYQLNQPIYVMPNGISTQYFFKANKVQARKELGLPVEGFFIGTAGELSLMKGLAEVYQAWSEIERLNTNTYLILAGKIDKKLPLPTGDRVIYLGQLKEQDVGYLFRALDIGLIPAKDSDFGKYCFPQKMYEMLACNLDIVASKVGEISKVLKEYPNHLYEATDTADLTRKVLNQYNHMQKINIPCLTWAQLVADIDKKLTEP